MNRRVWLVPAENRRTSGVDAGARPVKVLRLCSRTRGCKRGAVWRRFEIALFETMQAGADSEGFEAMRVGAERHRFGAALFGTALLGTVLVWGYAVWNGAGLGLRCSELRYSELRCSGLCRFGAADATRPGGYSAGILFCCIIYFYPLL